jgi:hypothetical protein
MVLKAEAKTIKLTHRILSYLKISKSINLHQMNTSESVGLLAGWPVRWAFGGLGKGWWVADNIIINPASLIMALEMVGVGHKSFQYRIPYAGSNLIA